jgi:hypothetical protein
VVINKWLDGKAVLKKQLGRALPMAVNECRWSGDGEGTRVYKDMNGGINLD